MAERPILVDLTRTVNRADRAPSGIDRVERAYADHVLGTGRPVFGAVRRQLGYSVLTGPQIRELMRLSEAGGWAAGERPQDRGRATLRRLGAGFVPRPLWGAWLRRSVGGGTYLALSHTGFDAAGLGAMGRAGMRRVAMVHDTIPLDLPQAQTPASRARFEAMLGALSAHADHLIYNSAASEAAARPHLERLGRMPPGTVARLGVSPPEARPEEVAGGMPPAPYFLALGTIEPRKNVGFLLDLWEHGAPGTLVVAGRRGWMSEDLFARLDARPPRVREIASPTDGAVGALLRGAAGLLMPSSAEGFGLPAAEASALGLRVLCNDLPVYREFLGETGVYARTDDPYAWIRTIEDWAARPGGNPPKRLPGWAEHFERVAPLI